MVNNIESLSEQAAVVDADRTAYDGDAFGSCRQGCRFVRQLVARCCREQYAAVEQQAVEVGVGGCIAVVFLCHTIMFYLSGSVTHW